MTRSKSIRSFAHWAILGILFAGATEPQGCTPPTDGKVPSLSYRFDPTLQRDYPLTVPLVTGAAANSNPALLSNLRKESFVGLAQNIRLVSSSGQESSLAGIDPSGVFTNWRELGSPSNDFGRTFGTRMPAGEFRGAVFEVQDGFILNGAGSDLCTFHSESPLVVSVTFSGNGERQIIPSVEQFEADESGKCVVR